MKKNFAFALFVLALCFFGGCDYSMDFGEMSCNSYPDTGYKIIRIKGFVYDHDTYRPLLACMNICSSDCALPPCIRQSNHFGEYSIEKTVYFDTYNKWAVYAHVSGYLKNSVSIRSTEEWQTINIPMIPIK